MPHHIYSWISGFGLTLLPFAPFRVGQGETDPLSLDILYFATGGEQFARVIADGNGGFASKIDQNARSVYDVVEIRPGPALPKWIIETSAFTCEWPMEYELVSTDFPHEAAIINLLSSDQKQIFIQSSQHILPLRQMPVRGQKIVSLDESSGSIELQYRYENLLWYQRHQIVSFGVQALLVSCQSPNTLAASVRAAAVSVAKSIILTQDER